MSRLALIKIRACESNALQLIKTRGVSKIINEIFKLKL